MTTEPKASLGGDEPLAANAPSQVADLQSVAMWMGFAASVIKSGEPWTDQCQREYDEAKAAFARIAASPVLPVEVREALADMILLAEVASAMIHDRDLCRRTERRITKARAILSTITGDA